MGNISKWITSIFPNIKFESMISNPLLLLMPYNSILTNNLLKHIDVEEKTNKIMAYPLRETTLIDYTFFYKH